MARTVIHRKGNRPLKIVNKFDGEEGSSFMDKFNAFQFSDKGRGVLNGLRGFNAATAKMNGQQPSMLSLDGFDYSQSGKAGGVFQAVDETAQALQGISNLTKGKRKSLSDIVGLAYGGRLYGLGGDVVGNAIKGTTGLVGNAIQQASIADTSELREGIRQRGNVKINASNYDDLQNAWSQRSDMHHITAKDLRSNSVFDDIINSVSASAQGAGLGSMFKDGGYIPTYSYYPNNQYALGGIIGGVAGGLSSVVGSIFGRVRAHKEAKKVNQLVDAMNNRNYMSYVNNANNIDTQNDLNAMANYAALGGMLDYLSPLYQTGDSLQYDYLQNRNNLLQEKINNSSDKSKDDELINSYASGGGIHINPKNKGKLTATAKRTGKSFSELAHSKNPTTRKRAQFALNARHFNHKHKHALGGDLQSNGADWDLGFTTIGNGGTHEMNPNEGVQMGIDNQGIPNLVEQGEVIYNNYVFSNRLPLDKETAIQFNLPASFAGMTFAKASEKASKEMNERPNDPISKRGLDATMQKLQSAQEYVRQQQQANRTKEMINNMSPEELQGLMAMANQGMQQQAQDQAMQEQAAQEQMMAQQGIDPNTLDAEALYGACGGRLARKFAEGDTLSTPSVSPANYGETFNPGKWLQFLAENKTILEDSDWYKNYAKNPNAHKANWWLSDFLAKNSQYLEPDSSIQIPQSFIDAYDENYANPQPLVNAPKEGLGALIPALQAFDAATGTSYAAPFADLTPGENGQYAPWFNENGENVNQYAYRIWKESQKGEHPIDISALPSDIQDYIAAQEDNREANKLSLLRYAGIVPQLVGLGLSAKKPNNTYAERLIEAAQNTGYTPVKAEPIGNYLQYTPIDRNFYTNQLAAQANAQRRALINLSNANRGTAAANILASDYNNIKNLGDLAFNAENTNWQRRKDVGEFNRMTNQFNSQQAFEAAKANQNAALSARNANLSLLAQGLDWQREDEKDRWSNIVGNLGQIGKYLSDVGQDALNNNLVKTTPGIIYASDLFGQNKYLNRTADNTKEKDAYGGRLRKNRRRRNV